MCREERMWSSMARNTMQQHCTIHSVSYLLLLGDERRTETWRLQRCQYAIKSRFRQCALSVQWKQTHSRNYNCTCLSCSFSSNLAISQYSYPAGMIMSSSLFHCCMPLFPHHNEEIITFPHSYNHKPISFHRDNSALKNEVVVHAIIPFLWSWGHITHSQSLMRMDCPIQIPPFVHAIILPFEQAHFIRFKASPTSNHHTFLKKQCNHRL